MSTQWFDEQRYRARAERALQGKELNEVFSSYKAIVGPMNVAQYQQDAQEARRLLSQGQRPSAIQLAALEFAIRMMRPAPLVQAGKVAPLPENAVSAFPVWADFCLKALPILNSIGRIERVIPHQVEGQHLGTGFLVSERLLVTNQHVLAVLSYGTGVLERGQGRVRFQHEYKVTPTEGHFEIVRVVDVHDVEDLALLEIDPVPLSPQRQVLTFDPNAAQPGEPVVAIGYPANDPLRNPEFAPLIFGNIFGVKRAAPGEVLSRSGTTVHHDCTTLGGNSGSPVLSLRSGQVIGVHKEGMFLYRDGAVEAATARDFVTPHL